MTKRTFLTRSRQFWFSRRRRRSLGFTLIELLIVTLIASGLVSGLMYVVVELMQADQRESAQAETQREMQLAIDYISTELREAVYVYTGTTIEALRERNNQSLLNFLPASLSEDGTVPIIAFWKHKRFPTTVIDACARANFASADMVNGLTESMCHAGSSLALVVYSLEKKPTSGIWKGNARITRYELSQFNTSSTIAQAFNNYYVNPGNCNNNFTSWPFCADEDTGRVTNQQTVRPANTPFTLVDFVDLTARDISDANLCTTGYLASPTERMLSNAELDDVRSFYACVADPTADSANQNQEVLLYLTGNATGRPGGNGFTTSLETRVLGRSVLERSPQD